MNLMSPGWTGGERCSEDADDVLPQHPQAQAGDKQLSHLDHEHGEGQGSVGRHQVLLALTSPFQ